MIAAYPDASFICRLYDKSPKAERSRKYAADLKAPLPVSALLRYEFTQSVRLQMFRHDHDRTVGMSRKIGAELLERFTSDMYGILFAPVHVDMPAVLAIAETLSARRTRELGYRSLDILHVATALHLNAAAFLTFDTAQAMLARGEGMATPMGNPTPALPHGTLDIDIIEVGEAQPLEVSADR